MPAFGELEMRPSCERRLPRCLRLPMRTRRRPAAMVTNDALYPCDALGPGEEAAPLSRRFKSTGVWLRACASRRVALFLAVFGLLGALAPGTSRADEVDIAVEAVAVGGYVVGINIGSEKELVKTVVRCAAVERRPLLDCARNVLIGRLPQDAQPLAQCLLGGGKTVQDCLVSAAVSHMPPLAPQTQQLVECIVTGADLGECGRRFAMDQLSAAERDALRQAFETLERLKIDEVAKNPLTDTPGSIQNIIGIVQGIREDNWAMVLRHGGAEVVKAAGKAIVRIFVPPLAPLLDPAIDAVVEHRIDLFARIIAAAKARDERRLGELAVEIAVTLELLPGVVPVCGVVQAIGWEDLQQWTCGNLGRGLRLIQGVGGDVVDFGVSTLRDVADALGINTGERVSDCGRGSDYYAQNMALCLPHAAFYDLVGDERMFARLEWGLNQRCRDKFRGCHVESTLDRICARLGGDRHARSTPIARGLNKDFREQAVSLTNALRQAAAMYARAYRPITLEARMGESCDPLDAVRRFVPDCVRALRTQFPLQGAQWARCNPGLGWQLPGMDDVLASACRAGALSGYGGSLRATCNFRWTAETCRPPGRIDADGACVVTSVEPLCPPGVSYNLREGRCELPTPPPVQPPPTVIKSPPHVQPPPPTCRGDMVPAAQGGCECRPGTVLAGGRCVAPCPEGMTGTPPNCRCAGGTILVGRQCVPPCSEGMVGRPPNCRCPGGAVLREGQCVRPCPAGMVGTQPNCRCPDGTVSSGGRCVRPCPEGMVGTPPYCRCPSGTVQVGGRCVQPCPSGMLGTPPNCRCPDGTVSSGGRCVRPCPEGMVGTPPYCRCAGGSVLVGGRCVPPCPPGMVGTPPNCRPISCPAGTVGRPPNCYRPAPPPPRFCPQGTFGTPPNCYRGGCPPGMVGTPPNCRRPAAPPPGGCPPGMIRRYGGCYPR